MNMMPARILVTLDGSPLAAAAVPVAARLATGLKAEVVLLRVVPPVRRPPPPAAADLPGLIDLEERQAREELAQHQAAFAGLPVEQIVLVGDHPATEIIDWLRRHPVDFAVMATHGHSGLRQIVTGSVTEAVLRSGLAPVIAVRPVAATAGARS